MSALVKLIYPALLALLAGQGAEAGEYQLRISKQDNKLVVERAGERVRQYCWTDGSIALTNEEIRELRQFIQPGVTVLIRP